ncbi:MAG: hypothetical protein HY712_06030 [candidate division NC10 bacterium]|nr:hypothetical protein [candidate division NC10 bacterium]
MANIGPLDPSQVNPDLQESVDLLVRRFGQLPDIFSVMAHRPQALRYAELVTRPAAVREPDLQALRSFLSPEQRFAQPWQTRCFFSASPPTTSPPPRRT